MQHIYSITRRRALQTASAGFGMVALAGIRNETQAREQPKPLAPKQPHFPAKAKKLIFVHMNGSMSQHDTFEYKPKLFADDGKPGPGGGTLTAPKFRFQQYGETGSWFSELLP